MATKFKLTEERLNQLKQELLYLQTVREKEVAELIKEARSFGDLTENSEYDEAKTEQGKLYSKIAELQNIIENAEIIDLSAVGDTITLGSKVRVVETGGGEEEEYEIVGSQEADPMRGKISEESPFGKALMGHRKGDEVEVAAPAGVMKFKIVDFSR
jgi:transcription elongation factor GreA